MTVAVLNFTWALSWMDNVQKKIKTKLFFKNTCIALWFYVDKTKKK